MASIKSIVEGLEILAKTAEVPAGLAEDGETDRRTAHIGGAPVEPFEQCKSYSETPVQVSASRDDHLAAIRDDLLLVFAAYQRMKANGWTDPHPWTDKEYNLLIIEPGSTGVHVGYCDGEEFGYWVCDECTWPSRPLLVKRLDKRE